MSLARFVLGQDGRDRGQSDQTRQLHQENVMRANQLSDERVETKRRMRLAAEMQREEAIAQQLEMEKQRKEQAELARQQEERLAQELDSIRREKMRDEKLRQQIRQTAPELRDLERKLQAAYVTRERSAQITERQHMTATARQEDLKAAREIEEAVRQAELEEQQKERQQWEEARKYQADIERQLEDQERRKEEAYQEFLKEKLMIDEIVQQIHREDEAEAQRTFEAKQRTKEEMEEFLRQRDEWNRLEAQEMQRENEAIQRFAEEKQMAERARMRAQLEREAAKESVRQQLGSELARQQQEMEEMEAIRIELAEEEQRARERARQRQELQRRVEQQMQLRAAQQESMAELQRRREREQAEEEEFRRAMMEKFAADDRVEQMNAQKRRMRVLQHKRDVEKLIQERRQRKEFERQQVRSRGGGGTSFSQDDGTGQWTGSFWGLGDNVRARELTCLEMMGSATLLAPLLQDSNTVAPSASVVMIARLETTMALHTTTTQYQAIRRSMRFAPALVDTATTIIASHRQHRYLSVHLRRADFLRVRSANIPPLASTRKQILALARAHDIRALFIATDARRDDEEYDAFASNPPLPLVDTPQHIKSTLHPGQLAVVQQIVCARAFIFIGTEGSTFTRQIQEERQLRGHRSNTSLSLTSPRRATTEQG
ncbi:hypothetical protein PTSG_13129 [Salpingoeca rosetta]|uniref:Meiosis-specific nuclear structural protein 1 n=1 Tax=Salpingoeca rosetta (strain ATCC 50818 / BSB-021) TaxID=946362 RepID=F2USE0_SALR5|nr:uncharacterized protein PTSG_13129 [Salpingoeca rosetta]EGD81049.1 hypothetical protein PTSG_13129 [Salpingoeca rosetta]|eukprot:XP_004987919.1 hypothetical protein PTSG_13129 [Salpingoeca rosetta]